jgi:PAS domain-containing protein
MSQAARRALGFAPADLLGRPFAELFHSDDRATVATQLSQAAAGEPVRFHGRCLSRAGQPVPMAWAPCRASDFGVLLRFGKPTPGARRGRQLGTAFGRATAAYRADAPGPTKSEQRFRLLFENTLSLSAFQDVHGRTLNINAAFPGFSHHTGYTLAELVGHKPRKRTQRPCSCFGRGLPNGVFLPAKASSPGWCSARPKENVSAHASCPSKRSYMAARWRVACSGDCPPDKNATPGTVRRRQVMVASATCAVVGCLGQADGFVKQNGSADACPQLRGGHQQLAVGTVGFHRFGNA